jgi:hypothetical protein
MRRFNLIRYVPICVAVLIAGCASGDEASLVTANNGESPVETVCDDGIDNDGDQAVDCSDRDCVDSEACAMPPEDCSNGVDDDGDGAVDCLDDECAADEACSRTEDFKTTQCVRGPGLGDRM